MILQKLLITSLLYLISNLIFAQNINKRIVFDGNYSYEFEINQSNKKIKLKEYKDYYWYKSNKIFHNFYAYSGKLLHGNFQKKKLKSLELLEKGTFKYGLKNGLWKEWFVNGKLKKTANWKSGILNGLYTSYDNNGNTLLEGNYKNGEKNGKWIDFQKKDTLKYHKGILKQKKKSLKEFIYSIFKRKNKSDLNNSLNNKSKKENKKPKKKFFKSLFKRKKKSDIVNSPIKAKKKKVKTVKKNGNSHKTK